MFFPVYFRSAAKHVQDRRCPCCGSDEQNDALLILHLLKLHKMSRKFATGFVIRRKLIESIVATRGPLLCKKCSHPVGEEEVTKSLDQSPQGTKSLFSLNEYMYQHEYRHKVDSN